MINRYTYTSHGTISADGSSAAVDMPMPVCALDVYMGTGVTFGSGTVKVQVTFDGTNWIDAPSCSFSSATASTKKARYLIFGKQYRITVTGSTTPTLHVRSRVTPLCDLQRIRIACESTADNLTNGPYFKPVGSSDVVVTAAYGTFDSGTVSTQTSPDGGTTKFLMAAALSATNMSVFENSEGEDGFYVTVASIASTTASFVVELCFPMAEIDITHFDNVSP